MGTGDRPEPPLDAIVLAAGAGARFGGAKLLAPWRGGLLIEAALAAACASPARGVILVTGAHPQVADAARAWAEAAGESARLRLAHAIDHGEGMAASLRTGLAVLPGDCAGVFVFLGDMPCAPPGLGERLARELEAGALAAAPVHTGRRGHPVLFAKALFPALADLRGDEGARAVLARLGERLSLVETDEPGVLKDIDTPQDLISP